MLFPSSSDHSAWRTGGGEIVGEPFG